MATLIVIGILVFAWKWLNKSEDPRSSGVLTVVTIVIIALVLALGGFPFGA